MRRPLVIASLFLCGSVTACFVVDEDLLGDPPSGSTDGGMDASVPPGDGDGPDTGPPCVPSTEICNAVDDDCDGDVDEAAAADADCETRIINAVTFCDDDKGVCVPVKCNSGFLQCDGEPSNGCEPECECNGVGCDVDAGAEDAGI